MFVQRLLENKLQRLAKNFKAVLVVGARQVGKSTLLSHCFPDYKHITFDALTDDYGAKEDPIEIKCKGQLNHHDLRGLKAFNETYAKQNVMPGIIIYAGNECYPLSENR